MKPTLLVCALIGAFGQDLSVGLKGGIRATGDITGQYSVTDESKRYIAGPFVELGLPFHLGVEFDALYRRVGDSYVASTFAGSSITRERANSWEFPIQARYRLPVPLLHPYVGGGFNTRRVEGTDVSSGSYQTPYTGMQTFFSSRIATQYPVTHGLIVSGGITAFDHWHLRFTPEIRYVRWNSPYLSAAGGDGSYQLQSPRNEVFVLVGVAWHR